MTKPPHRPTQLVGRVFRGSDAVAKGLLTRDNLRSRAWRQLFRGVYADAALPITHLTRIRAVSDLLLPPGAAIAGRSAAALYGAPVDKGPVEVWIPRQVRFGPVQGIKIHTGPLDDADLTIRDGIRVTTSVRTCWDLACWHDLVEAVMNIDSLLARHLVTTDSLRGYALDHAGRRGWRRLLRATDLADGGAESPPESRLRIRLVLAGIARPVTQYVINRNGRFLARVDLAWPEQKVAVEYDGMGHADPDQLHRDRRRLNQLLGEGWLVLHLTAERFRRDFPGFLAELRTALDSRRAR